MSVRIYQISKETNMENKDILALLRERGFEVKSASSSIDNISAEALIAELKAKNPAPEGEAKAEAEEEKVKQAAPKIELPAGAIVRSAADIEQEKQEKADKDKAAAEVKIAEARSAKVAAARPAAQQPPKPMVAGKAPALPPMGNVATKAPPMPPLVGSPSKPPPVKNAPPAPAPIEAKTPPATPAGKPAPAVPANKAVAGNAPKMPPPVVQNPSSPAPPPPAPAKPDAKPADGSEAAPESGEAADSGDVKLIQLKPPIVVRDFAVSIGLKPFRLISELMEMGIFASMNQTIEEDVAQKIAEKHGFILEVRHRGESQDAPKKEEKKPEIDESALMEPRPPVVCVLGHVDHGKTTVLDTIRKANVVAGEAGGITQHVGAYQVEHNDQKITFLDTPGHAAFSKIRERGANVTDIAVLVVAADDGFMPQTDEALKFAQKANVPVVVAINKIDAKGANVDRVKQMMQERNIAPEDWGGETLCAEISALKGENIDGLLELILLQAEVSELKANPKCKAEGIIVESQMEVGRGSTATIIVEKGTLKVGDAVVCGKEYCKVRAMMDGDGKNMKSATPATPARLLGWSGAPPSGSKFRVVKNEKEAKREAAEAETELKRESANKIKSPAGDLESLMAAIDSQQNKTFRVVLKADVHGSVEALQGCLEDIKSDKVNLQVVDASVGQISKNDITLASTAEATIVGFNVKLESGASAVAKHHNVSIIQHSIIYELIDQVTEGMAELLDPEYREFKVGAAEVRQVFPVSRGVVAGCMVTEGRIQRGGLARVFRKDKMLFESKIGALKRFKDDTNEVRAGYECGIQIDGAKEYVEGDVIECFEVKEFRSTL